MSFYIRSGTAGVLGCDVRYALACLGIPNRCDDSVELRIMKNAEFNERPSLGTHDKLKHIGHSTEDACGLRTETCASNNETRFLDIGLS